MSIPSDSPDNGPGDHIEPTLADETVRAFIEGRINFERLSTEKYGLTDFKLDRMRSLLDRLGNPQRTIPTVHIAGTKGKGSTAAMTAAILAAAGHRVGLYTSPHIEHFGERMTVDGRQPSANELLSLVDRLRPVVEEMDTEGSQMRATFFEVLTAMAWLHFVGQSADDGPPVDVVVLETGLGGRLDATNVCEPVVSIITTISQDHERLLGSTLAEIAAEKAGIIKPSVSVISGVRPNEPRRVIRDAASQQQATLYELDHEIVWQYSSQTPPTLDRKLAPSPAQTGNAQLAAIVDVTTPWRSHDRLPVSLPGTHQADNLALAVAACDLLNAQGISVSEGAVTTGLGRVDWPLRIEVVRQQPLVVLDSAHNEASVTALIDTLTPLPVTRRIVVFATSRDKNMAPMLRALGVWCDEIILTEYQNNPRAVSLEQLVEAARDEPSLNTEPSPKWREAKTPADAWQLANSVASPEDLICAAGSFFLAAELRVILRNSPG